eukprot:gene24055-biopygen10410
MAPWWQPPEGREFRDSSGADRGARPAQGLYAAPRVRRRRGGDAHAVPRQLHSPVRDPVHRDVLHDRPTRSEEVDVTDASGRILTCFSQKGMIRVKLQEGVGKHVIRALYSIGSHRVDGVAKQITKSEAQEAKGRGRTGKKVTTETRATAKSFCRNIKTEQGFAPGCTHRKAHVYLHDGDSYLGKHRGYKAAQIAAGLAFVGWSLFLTILHLVFPSLRASKTQQDVCNVCARLDVVIADIKLQLKAARGATELERLNARLEDAAVQPSPGTGTKI